MTLSPTQVFRQLGAAPQKSQRGWPVDFAVRFRREVLEGVTYPERRQAADRGYLLGAWSLDIFKRVFP